ncbi:hypothetical protein [Paenibacillus faecalis]|nr:hypothetical protein [Paenibacillus faecalis]
MDFAILFSEGNLDMFKPYGVLVNCLDEDIVGFNDLMEAEDV